MAVDSADPIVETHASTGQWALAGAISAAAALGASELLAGILNVGRSIVTSIGDLIIDISPQAVSSFAIGLFGLYDKLVLIISIIIVTVVAGAVVGALSKRGMWIAYIGYTALGAVAVYAVAVDPLATTTLGVAAVVLAMAVGLYAFTRLVRLAEQSALADPGEDEVAQPDRRAFLVGLGAVGTFALAAAALGSLLTQRMRVAAASRSQVVLPPPRNPIPAPTSAMSFNVPGLAQLVTPNDDFYKIDTTLSVPRIDPQEWTLKITGLVDRPLEITYQDLLDMPMEERYVTLCCVSNAVGGDLIGNAKWLGVRLQDVLERAQVHADAGQIVGRSVDEFTVGFPTEIAFDGREALIAVGMNGEPLPFDHGFPARLVVSGLYGYVSATKWLSEIELTTWDGFDSYWVPRGWAKEGPIKTQSRIDVPLFNQNVPAGPVEIAGVAWAQNTGITAVEVRVDQEPWQPAQVTEPISDDTWVQWQHTWDASPGDHLIGVRATDATGVTQTDRGQSARPDGATGHHRILVKVR